jgi:hypothetical protein
MPGRSIHDIENAANHIDREMGVEHVRHAVDEDPAWLLPPERLFQSLLPNPWGERISAI